MLQYYHDYFVTFTKDKTVFDRSFKEDEYESTKSIDTYPNALIAADTIGQVRSDIERIQIIYCVYSYDEETDEEVVLQCSVIEDMIKCDDGGWRDNTEEESLDKKKN